MAASSITTVPEKQQEKKEEPLLKSCKVCTPLPSPNVSVQPEDKLSYHHWREEEASCVWVCRAGFYCKTIVVINICFIRVDNFFRSISWGLWTFGNKLRRKMLLRKKKKVGKTAKHNNPMISIRSVGYWILWRFFNSILSLLLKASFWFIKTEPINVLNINKMSTPQRCSCEKSFYCSQ